MLGRMLGKHWENLSNWDYLTVETMAGLMVEMMAGWREIGKAN